MARRLRAPLQKHLDHYLGILFPGAHIEVADDLSPGAITRIGPLGQESGGFEELSVGTREQMGIVARLAYADLLQEAGRPTLLILDDALVNTDDDRLGQMKRVLFDAAQRHQGADLHLPSGGLEGFGGGCPHLGGLTASLLSLPGGPHHPPHGSQRSSKPIRWHRSGGRQAVGRPAARCWPE